MTFMLFVDEPTLTLIQWNKVDRPVWIKHRTKNTSLTAYKY